MSYFKDGKNTKSDDTSNSKSMEYMNELGRICLDELMLSSDAYICMIKMNMHGYKRLHRYLSKKFHDLFLQTQCKAIENFGTSLDIPDRFQEYHVNNIKQHLEKWNDIMKIHIKEVGEVVKGILEEDGYICCIAQEVQKILYKNIIKNERAIDKFNQCDWSKEIIFEHDRYIHEKMKEEDK